MKTLIEPSHAERAELPDASREYINDLEIALTELEEAARKDKATAQELRKLLISTADFSMLDGSPCWCGWIEKHSGACKHIRDITGFTPLEKEQS
jgi:hypothetical protein